MHHGWSRRGLGEPEEPLSFFPAYTCHHPTEYVFFPKEFHVVGLPFKSSRSALTATDANVQVPGQSLHSWQWVLICRISLFIFAITLVRMSESFSGVKDFRDSFSSA